MERYELYQSISRKTDDEWGSAINNFGMAKGQVMIIWTLFSFGRPCTQKEICDDWYENKQTINSAAKKLIEEGYIDIAPSPENFREKLLTFTEKGKFLAMRTVEKMLAAEKRAFARLSENEQEELIRINKKHYDFLKEEFEKIKGENQ
ncbi:MAG: winged helix DNA-binding protein [Oscillospiraceae bacterium]|nr:winged helix DNA-binding protein [Oscillospiraceae bacterium]MBR6656938.1 winged helix DNA-binding protein [Oscillospiraceae bacterium]